MYKLPKVVNIHGAWIHARTGNAGQISGPGKRWRQAKEPGGNRSVALRLLIADMQRIGAHSLPAGGGLSAKTSKLAQIPCSSP